MGRIKTGLPPQKTVVCSVRSSRPVSGNLQFVAFDVRNDRSSHPACYIVLNREDVGHVRVIVLGPDVMARIGIDQLGGYPHSRPQLTDAAFDHILRTELAPNGLHIEILVAVRE